MVENCLPFCIGQEETHCNFQGFVFLKVIGSTLCEVLLFFGFDLAKN